MLTQYLTQTQNLLQAPTASNALYNTETLTGYINTARGQIAGEAQCVQYFTSFTTTAGNRSYPFSSIPNSPSAGIQAAFAVKTLWYTNNGGNTRIQFQSFEWFSLYNLNEPTQSSGIPTTWTQYGQGTGGQIWFDPVPDNTYTISVDGLWYPIELVDDTTIEAIPYFFTDAVPYYAAYLALLSAQIGVRTQQSDEMYKRYEEFMSRARNAVTSPVLPWQYEKTPIPGGLNAAPAGR